MAITVSVIVPDSVEYGTTKAVPMPARFDVCRRCEGTGTTVNPAVDGTGLSYSDLHDDPDFAAAYFGGRYDVACPECDGKRVVPVVNVGLCSYAQKRDLVRKRRWDYEGYLCRMAAEQERRVGA